MTNTFPTIENIVVLVSQEMGVEPRYVLGVSRVSRIVRARHMVMFLAREHTDFSYPRIGMALCRDHSTVMHGVRKIYEQSYIDTDLKEKLTKIGKRIQEGANNQDVPIPVAPLLTKTQKISRQAPRPFMRHRHKYHYGKPKSDTPSKERKCLGCGETFISSGPGNRLCWCCRSDAKRSSGIPDHYIGTVT